MASYGMVLYDMVLYGIVLHGMVLYGIVWYHIEGMIRMLDQSNCGQHHHQGQNIGNQFSRRRLKFERYIKFGLIHIVHHSLDHFNASDIHTNQHQRINIYEIVHAHCVK